MISYQENFFTPTRLVDAKMWYDITTSSANIERIKRIREYRRQGMQKEADAEKRRLPAVCYQATFDETLSKKGLKGAWRKQSAARLNGLYMLDVDHMEEEPKEWFRKRCATDGETKEDWCRKQGIVLVHVTSSGSGLRFVAKADASVGNISDNQHALATRLNVVCDEACKDASRLSFVPTWDDIIFEDHKTLIEYNNEEYERKYGEEYRQGRSNPRQQPLPQQGGAGGESVLSLEYHGTTYGKIIECWLDANAAGWRDAVERGSDVLNGQRHRLLLKMASDLRYICDKKEVFTALVKESPLGKMLCGEGETEEVGRIADDSLRYRLWRDIPQRLRTILASAGVREHAGDHGGAVERTRIDYDAWWHRLQPLLDESPYLRDACALLPERHRIGGVLAAGAMFGTYLSRCWWQHFDGKTYRLSYIVYVIGDAASGKSAMVDLDRLIMAPMLAADKVGREWERQYKEEMKARAASSKNAKEAAPEQQHPVIRYLPSTISNAMLYRRLTDAIDKDCVDAHGDTTHLHCYTFEAELATALRAQQGSWAGKLDLECKSFQNEMAGVDYANDQSQNGIIEINWNQVITGTPDALRRKIRKATVLDGLVTRLCIFPMPSNDYAMIERRQRIIEHERDCRLRSVGMDLEKIAGELHADRLVDFCYDYEVSLTEQARLNEDRCLDYFRKRIPLIMMRYALVRAVLRQLKELQDGQDLQIIDSDLEFARLIGDFVLEMQIYMFGTDVMEALEQQAAAFTPRRRSNKVKERYEKLGREFTLEEVKALMAGCSPKSSYTIIDRWKEYGIVKETEKGKYVKLVNDLT